MADERSGDQQDDLLGQCQSARVSGTVPRFLAGTRDG
jgi:hypothetical protein